MTHVQGICRKRQTAKMKRTASNPHHSTSSNPTLFHFINIKVFTQSWIAAIEGKDGTFITEIELKQRSQEMQLVLRRRVCSRVIVDDPGRDAGGQGALTVPVNEEFAREHYLLTRIVVKGVLRQKVLRCLLPRDREMHVRSLQYHVCESQRHAGRGILGRRGQGLDER